MKSIFLLLALVLLTSRSFAQQTTGNNWPANSTDYERKAKSLDRTGLIIVGTGVVCFVSAFILPRGEGQIEGTCPNCKVKYKNTGLKTGLLIASGVITIASTPFFVKARKIREKGELVGFKLENTFNPYYSGVANIAFPAVSLKLRL